MFGDRAQRTEKPTPRRLDKARREGNVARSKELPGALGLAAFLIFAYLWGGGWLARLEELMAGSIGGLVRPELTPDELTALLAGLTMTAAGLLAMPLGVMVAAAVAGNLLQGPPPLTLKPLKPDLSRLHPLKGLGKVFRLRSLVETAKTLLKMLLYAAIAAGAVREALVDGGLAGAPGAEGALAAVLAVSGKVIFRVVLLALGLALLDYLFARYDHVRQLKMTKQEVKDERRETEGDPLVKARIKSKQMALSRSRMMADVSKATVVVTNPTHYAVALRYVPGETDVPRLLAKGRGWLAERIREIALEHRIPVVSDPPLARALYRAVPLGGFIPAKLFRAVAEVLALVLRGQRQRRAPGPEPPR